VRLPCTQECATDGQIKADLKQENTSVEMKTEESEDQVCIILDDNTLLVILNLAVNSVVGHKVKE